MRRRSDQTLKRYYREFNRQYFGGKLPSNVTVRWRTPGDFKREDIALEKGEMGTTFFTQNKADEVLLAPWLKERGWGLVQFTLLHEMVHVKLENRPKDPHGRAFEREMLRLAKMGAFKKTKGGLSRW